MSVHMRRPKSELMSFIIPAFWGIVISLLLCAFIAMCVFRGAVGNAGGRIFAAFCPVAGTFFAAYRTFICNGTAIAKRGIGLILASLCAYLPLYCLYALPASPGRTFMSLSMRCVAGTVLGSMVAVLNKKTNGGGKYVKTAAKIKRNRSKGFFTS